MTFIIHSSCHVTLFSLEQTRVLLYETLIMFFFILLYLLSFLWEECRSFPHSRIYTTDEFQIQPNESNTTYVPPVRQVSHNFFIFITHTCVQSNSHMQTNGVKSTLSHLYVNIYQTLKRFNTLMYWEFHLQ